MTPATSTFNRPRRLVRRGLGMVEALISLAIAAALLTAVGVAFKTSADAIQINDDFFRASQSARVSVARIVTQIRRGVVDDASTQTNLHLITDTGQDITYRYDAANQQILLVTNAVTTDPDYVLARNVTVCRFLLEMGTDYNHAACVSRVSVEIGVNVGGNQVLLSGSGAPRRNVTF